MMRPIGVSAMAAMFAGIGTACVRRPVDSDLEQSVQQERSIREGAAQTGMPSIRSFRERRLMKELYELRDQNLVTYTYMFAQQSGRLVFLCDSIGYALPAATQYTNPQKLVDWTKEVGYLVLPQADPNGLFSPASAEGTWVMCKDPAGTAVKPVYVEERITVAPFRLGTAPVRPEGDGK